jgi:purine nucleosidase
VPRAFFIDTDVALGARSGDVDDGFALAAVIRDPDARLLGVSTVFGNTRADVAARCARELVEIAGSQVTVTTGAMQAGDVTEAAHAIARLPAGTHVLALGPLTNVAAALALDRSLAERITLHLVGGNPSSLGRWPPWWPFEFNLAKDPAAARAVFASEVARHVYPLDVCAELRIGPRQLLRLGTCGRLGALLARRSLRWLAYAPLRYRSLSFPLWDLVPALAALGRLSHRSERRRYRLAGRGLLVRDPSAPESRVLRALDPTLTPFFELLGPSPGSAPPGR